MKMRITIARKEPKDNLQPFVKVPENWSANFLEKE